MRNSLTSLLTAMLALACLSSVAAPSSLKRLRQIWRQILEILCHLHLLLLSFIPLLPEKLLHLLPAKSSLPNL
jgi:hypothetical protein